jgi:hypothetical protein
MDTAPTFDAQIRFRALGTVKARLIRIARKKGKKETEIYREAVMFYADREERKQKQAA